MIFLDTDILVDVLHDQKAALGLVAALEARGEELATTTINVAELYRGAEGEAGPQEALKAVEDLLDRLLEVTLDHAAARRFGVIMAALDRAGRPMPAVDALVAAIVLEGGGRIATRNRRHFARVPGLQVVP